MIPQTDAGQATAATSQQAAVTPYPPVQRITVRQYIEEKWGRRDDVEAFLMYSPLRTGSRVWRVFDVLPGFPLDADSIRPSIVWFHYTDPFHRRRRGHHSVRPDDELVAVFKLPRPGKEG